VTDRTTNQARPAPDLGNITFVLSRTTEPMNIGAAARAMKNMGLSRLVLINPRDPFGERSRVMAHGAEDVLERARVVLDHKAAIREMIVVAGSTARPRELRKGALLSPEELARLLVDASADGPVAMMFGSERMGLTNEEVYDCRYVTRIDVDPGQTSLNLAQAVMVYAYEIRRAWLAAVREPRRTTGRRPEMRVSHPHRSTKLPTQEELDTMYDHVGAAMAAVGYKPAEREKFLTYLRHLHMRAGIVDWEMQTYHLFARKILRALGAPPFRRNGET
jgi:tRNA (cytidine32/uridine32-2'-O)-methyltransferase